MTDLKACLLPVQVQEQEQEQEQEQLTVRAEMLQAWAPLQMARQKSPC